MLNKNEVIARFLTCLVLFILTGTEVITGWPATLCGVIGTIELATSLLGYSPLMEARTVPQRERPTHAPRLAH
ncbi:MAG TPA: hypothetical protein PLC88_00625 [Syntrophomonas sp.]|jgi:hypothetical protein|nr:hypothetical protein [Syntrophomonas sp.]HRW12572.1 hypothetical protein [Syntrophomonas sp.]